jgi:streptogramin lyase
MGTFASGGGLLGPGGMVFGPDGNLYATSFGGLAPNSKVIRYNGLTGDYIGDFVPVGSGGLTGAEGLVFGPDGNLYVTSRVTNQVLRYNGSTGAFLGVFATSGNNGPVNLVFGPDGNLYVLNSTAGSLSVSRFDGVSGAFLGNFVSSFPAGTDGSSLVFGPDGNLYVTTGFVGNSVLRFNGSTGQFMDEFVTGGEGGLAYATGLQFFTPVPEPGTLTLFGIGVLTLLGWAWRARGFCPDGPPTRKRIKFAAGPLRFRFRHLGHFSSTTVLKGVSFHIGWARRAWERR